MVEQTGEFIAATQDPSDPIGRIGNDWGFWDETWGNWHGGYANEAEARDALSVYVLTL